MPKIKLKCDDSEAFPKDKPHAPSDRASRFVLHFVSQSGVASENGKNRTLSFEQQPYRASGLNLVTAAVVLWNMGYLERTTNALRGNGHAVDNARDR